LKEARGSNLQMDSKHSEITDKLSSLFEKYTKAQRENQDLNDKVKKHSDLNIISKRENQELNEKL